MSTNTKTYYGQPVKVLAINRSVAYIHIIGTFRVLKVPTHKIK